jgi:hypothetical protein
MMTANKKCKQCGLPDLGITYGRKRLDIDDESLCLFCKDYNESAEFYQVAFQKNQGRLREIVEKIRGKQKYDAVVMFTGGKDSSYTAHLLSKEYKLKVLALTWDNGFFEEVHRKNISIMTSSLGIDHKFVSLGEDRLAEFYKNRFIKLGRFCGCAQPGVFFCAPEIARSEAPLIAMGVSFGQQLALVQNRFLFEFEPEYRKILQQMLAEKGFGINDFKDPGLLIGALLDIISSDFSDSMVDLLKDCVTNYRRMQEEERYFVLLALCHDFNHTTMSEILSQYGWIKPSGTHEAGHTSCIMEPLKGFVACKQDMLNIDYLELAAERRWGRFSEQLCEDVFPTLNFSEKEPGVVDEFLRVARMTREEFDRVLETRPFARPQMPGINWELAKRLPHGMSEDLLEKNMALAYNRGLP